MWSGGGNKDTQNGSGSCSGSSLLIPRILNQFIWNVAEPRVRDDHLWLPNSETMDGHKSQSRGMFLSNSIIVLNSMAITKLCPQPHKSLSLMAHSMDSISGLRILSVGQKVMFHMMCDRNLLDRLVSLLQLLLPDIRLQCAREPTVGVQLSSEWHVSWVWNKVSTFGWEMQRFWNWVVGFEKDIYELFQQQWIRGVVRD